MKNILLFLSALFLISCGANKPMKTEKEKLNILAEKYVRLGLTIGVYDGDFVDAYYGPDSLKPVINKGNSFPKDSLLAAVNDLKKALGQIADGATNDTIHTRANWIVQQLNAFGRRIKIFSGEYASFDEESKELFGAVAPVYPESYYQSLVAELDSLLPGKGSVQDRFQQLANKFIIPANKLDTVFKTAIAEARRRTLLHYDLPGNENFTMEYVAGKSWSGYNWYKGHFNSLIQISSDMPIFIERAIDLGCHEGYPGHHVYNTMLEKNLYRDKGWVEVSLYPLFSPQSLIAEGSANYGIDLAFPGEEKNVFTKEVLLPLAGLAPTGIDLYYKALSIKGRLNYTRNEIGRGLLNGSMSDTAAMRWLLNYALLNKEAAIKGLAFIKKNRSYVINYNYGQDLVKNYIASNDGTDTLPGKRWIAFGKLLSNEVTPGDLLKAQTRKQ
ncbi:hypothetical protein CLV51_10661 [Chitinophaga niastensis]|uniref:DUF885 domain-containing protein n=1 Tax=Chitinophaga niastensis TaxID=536980 RepID=A0A2P8HD79_CHINA|nr:hypothetical protein [Chitinophaga niastensis]PSL44196.1 hypothetical protein CLV51_10661 [Chitinophaga niastensis]